MQGRGHVPTSQLAEGRPLALEPLRWGLRASAARGLTPAAPNQGAGTKPGGRAPAGRAGRARLPPSGRPGRPTPAQLRTPANTWPGAQQQPAQQVPANADRCPAAPSCPSAAAVATESREPGRANAGPEDAGYLV